MIKIAKIHFHLSVHAKERESKKSAFLSIEMKRINQWKSAWKHGNSELFISIHANFGLCRMGKDFAQISWSERRPIIYRYRNHRTKKMISRKFKMQLG